MSNKFRKSSNQIKHPAKLQISIKNQSANFSLAKDSIAGKKNRVGSSKLPLMFQGDLFKTILEYSLSKRVKIKQKFYTIVQTS